MAGRGRVLGRRAMLVVTGHAQAACHTKFEQRLQALGVTARSYSARGRDMHCETRCAPCSGIAAQRAHSAKRPKREEWHRPARCITVRP